jgi:hypothetical protein
VKLTNKTSRRSHFSDYRATAPSEADDPISVILARLRPYPQARLETYANGIEVFSREPNGFTVAFAEIDEGYRVTCDGWYAYFASPFQALDCFFKALSPAARLRITARGSTRCRWRLELATDDGWTALAQRSRLVIPFWRPPEQLLLQNHLLEAA